MHLFLGSQASTGVDDLDVQLSGTFEDLDALLRRDVVSDLGSVGAVVHQEQFKFLDVLDGELQETVGQEVAGLLVRAVADLGHGSLAAETTAHGIVNTLGLSPGFLYIYGDAKNIYSSMPCCIVVDGNSNGTYVNALESVRLVALELGSSLLHDVVSDKRGDHDDTLGQGLDGCRWMDAVPDIIPCKEGVHNSTNWR